MYAHNVLSDRFRFGDNSVDATFSYLPQDLTPGTLVVGVITDVFNDEIEVDLPFHLTGYVGLPSFPPV